LHFFVTEVKTLDTQYFDNYSQLKDLYREALKFLQSSGINMESFKGSHICYRPESMDTYTSLKSELDNNLAKIRLVAESNFGGRKVSWYRYNPIPLLIDTKRFHFLEVPAPKVPNRYKEGFTHIAFTIPNHLNLDLIMSIHPDLPWIQDKKDSNGIIELEFGDNHQIKFHNQLVPQILNLPKT
jgi:predicted metalloenzyme YecM